MMTGLVGEVIVEYAREVMENKTMEDRLHGY